MGLSANDIARLGPSAQKQIVEQLRGELPRKDTSGKSRKYHNAPTQRVMPGGRLRTFDSKKEARRFDELLQMLRAGEIAELRLQQHFTLTEAWVTPEGVPVRALQYVADFAYRDREGKTIVEDVKGGKATQTQAFRMKKKLLLEKFGIQIKEV